MSDFRHAHQGFPGGPGLPAAGDVIDELHLWVFPTVAGSGQRLADGLAYTHFVLQDSVRFASGITVQVVTPL